MHNLVRAELATHGACHRSFLCCIIQLLHGNRCSCFCMPFLGLGCCSLAYSNPGWQQFLLLLLAWWACTRTRLWGKELDPCSLWPPSPGKGKEGITTDECGGTAGVMGSAWAHQCSMHNLHLLLKCRFAESVGRAGCTDASLWCRRACMWGGRQGPGTPLLNVHFSLVSVHGVYAFLQ